MKNPYPKYYLVEEIVGDKVYIYHRTGGGLPNRNDPSMIYQELKMRDQGAESFKLLKTIMDTGLAANSGVYGEPGIYSTYTLESQQTSYMRSYGPMILKCLTKLSNTLMFDKDWAIKTFGPVTADIKLQLMHFGIKRIMDKGNQAEVKKWKTKWPKFSSEVAINMTNTQEFRSWVQKGLIQAIIYTGSNDGRCLLAYDDSLVVPLRVNCGFEKELQPQWLSIKNIVQGRSDITKQRQQVLQQTKFDFEPTDPLSIKLIKVSKALKLKSLNELEQMMDTNYFNYGYHIDGLPILFSLIKLNDYNLIKKAVDMKYNPNAKNLKKESLLHICLFRGRLEAFKALLTAQVIAVNAQDTKGNSVVHYAAMNQRSRPQFLKLLQQRKDVNWNLKNQDRKSPADLLNDPAYQ